MIYIFVHKSEFRVGYYKMWSIGQRELSIPTVTKYCFDLFGTTIIFTRRGVH